MLKLLLMPLRALVRAVLAVLILFEEWGWNWFARIMARIARLPILHQLERWIANLPPYGALVMLIVPAILLLPVKLLALYLIGRKRAILGISVILIAKVVGTAVVARIFQLIHPALMRLPWFVPLYARWIRWKEGLLAWVRASWSWRWGRVLKRAIKRRLKHWRGQ